MKMTIRTILCTVVFAVLAVSCQKEMDGVEPLANTKETIEISINGLMGEYTQTDVTKASLVNTVRVSWEGTETVYVFDGTQCLGSLAASLDENGDDRYARLSTDDDHTVNAPAAGTEKLTLVYSPLLTEAPAVTDGAISISLAGQDGAKAPFVAYATLDYNNEEIITNAFASFKFATSVIKVNCTGLKANTAIDEATLSNVNTACKLTLSGTAAPTVAGDVDGTITRTNDTYFAASKVNGEGEAVFQIAVPKLGTASAARALTIAQDSDTFIDENFTKNSLGAATSVNTVCQLVKKQTLPADVLPGVFSVSANKKVYFSKSNLYADGDNALHFEANQYATASSWDASHVSHFTWSSTVAAAVGESYSGDNLFCDENNKVSVNGSEAIYYALSKDEWKYLFGNHSYKWVTVNGVNGYVIAPDGFAGTLADTYADDAALAADNLVFLPAAGARRGSFVSDVGDYGYYWSSTAYDWYRAYCVDFGSDDVGPDVDGGRGKGCSVRLITDVE